MVLAGGDFAPRGHLARSGDIFGYLYRAGLQTSSGKRSGMLLNILQCTRQSSTTKNYLAQNVNGVETEKPWMRGIWGMLISRYVNDDGE